MKYSISNIAWGEADDGKMYRILKENGFDGVEIAPTRLFTNPYDRLEEAHQYMYMLKNKYGLAVSSMQSIWYGVGQNIFGTAEDRLFLTDYTKKAILFAESMNCKNLVFGCPKNRNMPRGADIGVAKEFFKTLGDFAYRHGTNLAIEPNPAIYNTNFLNFTKDACEFVREIDSKGLKVNIDMGTIIHNGENPHLVKTYKTVVNHIHISRPHLAVIEPCREYRTLKKVLAKTDYDGYISIEMKNTGDLQTVVGKVKWLKEYFE